MSLQKQVERQLKIIRYLRKRLQQYIELNQLQEEHIKTLDQANSNNIIELRMLTSANVNLRNLIVEICGIMKHKK